MGKNKIVLSFLTGAAIGGIIAILVAPDKGQNTRASILDSSGDWLRRFKATYNDTIDNLTTALDSVAVENEEHQLEAPSDIDTNIVASDGKNQL